MTNVRFEITSINRTQPLGCKEIELPQFLRQKRSLRDFPGKDNLCFFRCLAYFKGSRTSTEIEKNALHYFRIWMGEDENPAMFWGITLDDLTGLENKFQVNITVLSLTVDGAIETIQASCSDNEKTMYLNLWCRP